MTTLHTSLRAAALGIGIAMSTAGSAPACDDLIDRLVAHGAQPALKNIDCGVLKGLGLDQGEATLTRVCYTSSGPTSRMEVDVSVTCKNSDKAFIKAQKTGAATAIAEVRGADCALTFVDFKPSGELEKAISGALDVKGRIGDAIKKGLAGAC